MIYVEEIVVAKRSKFCEKLSISDGLFLIIAFFEKEKKALN